MGKYGRTALAGAFIVVLALLASACGGGGSTSSNQTSDESSPSTVAASEGANATEGATDIKEEAQALVEKYEQPPTKVPEAVPLKKAPPTGKSVTFVGCGVPGCEAYGNYVEEGAKALGWSFKRYKGSVTPQGTASEMAKVVAERPDVFIACCQAPSIVHQDLAKLKQAGTVSVMCCTARPGTEDLTRLLSPPEHAAVAGRAVADLMLAEKGEDLNVLWIASPEFEVYKQYGEGIREEMTRLCPSCTMEELDISGEEIGKPQLQTQIVNQLRTHQDINYMVAMVGEMMSGVPAALKTAGITDVSIAAQSANETGLAGIANGEEFWGGGYYFGPEWGLFGLNIAVRTMLHEPLSEEAMTPEYLVTEKNLPDSVKLPPVIPDALQQYEKLWGV